MTVSKNSQGIRLPPISKITDSIDFNKSPYSAPTTSASSQIYHGNVSPQVDHRQTYSGANSPFQNRHSVPLSASQQNIVFQQLPQQQIHQQTNAGHGGDSNNPRTLPPISSLLNNSSVEAYPPQQLPVSYYQHGNVVQPQLFPTLKSSSPVLVTNSPIHYGSTAASPSPSTISLGSSGSTGGAMSSAGSASSSISSTSGPSSLSSGSKLKLRCECCLCESTPEWRRGPNGSRTLCNACGLYFAKVSKRKGLAYAAEEMKRKKEFKDAKRSSKAYSGAGFSNPSAPPFVQQASYGNVQYPIHPQQASTVNRNFYQPQCPPAQHGQFTQQQASYPQQYSNGQLGSHTSFPAYNQKY